MTTKFQMWLKENPAYNYLDKKTTVGGRSGLAGYIGLFLFVLVVIVSWHYQ